MSKFRDIEETCEELGIDNYTIKNDMSINVYGEVYISKLDLIEIPLNFNIVEGDFNCYKNRIKSLQGAPKIVKGDFDAGYNKLTSLEFMPIEISSDAFFDNNDLKTLKGMTEQSNNALINLQNNKLESLMYMKKGFKEIALHNNKLNSLKYLPDDCKELTAANNNIRDLNYIKNLNILQINDNPIYELFSLFLDTESIIINNNKQNIEYFNELDIITEDNKSVILDRLNYFLTDIGKKEINENYIKNYNIIK